MNSRYDILSLSGGGYLGLYTISVLEKMEEQFGKPIAKYFDLLAGTSIGGIIALALAAEVPAKNIKEAFELEGCNIFSDREPPSSRIGSAIDFLKSIGKSKYKNTFFAKNNCRTHWGKYLYWRPTTPGDHPHYKFE